MGEYNTEYYSIRDGDFINSVYEKIHKLLMNRNHLVYIKTSRKTMILKPKFKDIYGLIYKNGKIDMTYGVKGIILRNSELSNKLSNPYNMKNLHMSLGHGSFGPFYFNETSKNIFSPKKILKRDPEPINDIHTIYITYKKEYKPIIDLSGLDYTDYNTCSISYMRMNLWVYNGKFYEAPYTELIAYEDDFK